MLAIGRSQVAVEMLAIGRWRVHLDVAAAVDAMLAGHMPLTQLRWVGEKGEVLTARDTPASASAFAEGALSPQLAAQQALGTAGTPATSSGSAAAAAAANSGSSSGSGLALRLGQSPAEQTVRLFAYGLDVESLMRVVSAMGLESRLKLTPSLEEADAARWLAGMPPNNPAWNPQTKTLAGIPSVSLSRDLLSRNMPYRYIA